MGNKVKKKRIAWSTEEDRILKRHYLELGVAETAKLLPSRGTHAMKNRVVRLGIVKAQRNKRKREKRKVFPTPKRKQINLRVPQGEYFIFNSQAVSKGLNLSALFAEKLKRYRKNNKSEVISLPAVACTKSFVIQVSRVDLLYFNYQCKSQGISKSTLFRIINFMVSL